MSEIYKKIEWYDADAKWRFAKAMAAIEEFEGDENFDFRNYLGAIVYQAMKDNARNVPSA